MRARAHTHTHTNRNRSIKAAVSLSVTDCCSVCSGSLVKQALEVKVQVRVELMEAILVVRMETTISTARWNEKKSVFL